MYIVKKENIITRFIRVIKYYYINY